MTRPKAQLKLRQRPMQAAPAEAAPAHAYFDIYPAQLPKGLPLAALTKAGVRGAPGVDAAQALLASTLFKDRVRGEVLDLTAMGGLLTSQRGIEVRAVEGSAAALSVLEKAGAAPIIAAVGDPLEKSRTVCMVLAGDRGNSYIQAQLAWAHACTQVGGTLYLAGDKDKGYDRYVRQAAQLFGAGETVARDGGMRVGKLTRRPGPTPAQPEAERYEHAGVQVVGLAGVFSASKADKATALLLDTLQELDVQGKTVLDLGCGAGLIGAWAAQRGAVVTLLDNDLQSVRSSEATLQAGGLAGTVLLSDVDSALSAEQRYDVILSNPPFHVGRGMVLDVAAEFLRACERRLSVGGAAYIVANDFLPYEGLLGWAQVRELRRESGFKVLEVRER